jgi:hypothetical protein
MFRLAKFVSARVGMGALVLVAASSLGIASPVAAAGNSTTVFVTIGDCDIRGSGGPNRGTVKIEWRASDGTLRGLFTTGSSLGYWGGTGPYCFESGFGIEPGDTIKTTVKGAVRTFVVPQLTVRVNRDTDVVTGTTKPGSKLNVTLDGRGPGTQETYKTRNLHARSDGTYLADFRKGDKADIRGFDRIDVAWTNDRGDHVDNWNIAPGVHVNIGRSWIEAAGQAGQDATLKLFAGPGGSLIAKTGGIVYARYNAFLWLDASGEEVPAAEGNRVATDLAADASFVLPTMETTIDRKTDVVHLATGLGPGIGVFMQPAKVTSSDCYSWANLDTDADGSVTVDFTSDAVTYPCDLGRGDRMSITIRLRSGDEVTKVVVVE